MGGNMNAKRNLKRSVFIMVVVLVLSASLAADTITWTVSAPFDDVYAAALRAVTEMKFEIKVAEKSAGLVTTQHMSPFGEPNHYLDLNITKKDQETEVRIDVRKRRLSVSGGSPKERIAEFKKAFSSALGDQVTITDKKSQR
jgi:hypothetical protein